MYRSITCMHARVRVTSLRRSASGTDAFNESTRNYIQAVRILIGAATNQSLTSGKKAPACSFECLIISASP